MLHHVVLSGTVGVSALVSFLFFRLFNAGIESGFSAHACAKQNSLKMKISANTPRFGVMGVGCVSHSAFFQVNGSLQQTISLLKCE